jgi:alpha-galactosidase
MKLQQLSQFLCGDMIINYMQDIDTGLVGMYLIPADKKELDNLSSHRNDLAGIKEIEALRSFMLPPDAFEMQPLVEFSLAGDVRGTAFSQGLTMRGGEASRETLYHSQDILRENGKLTITTISRNESRGVETIHTLSWKQDAVYITVHSAIKNIGNQEMLLDMASSFNLGFITPFDKQDAKERLNVHRLRSSWAAEGRLDKRTLESLELERSWSGHAVKCERFGQIGSMPVRGWFPLLGIEDTEARVMWGAQVNWAGSWQMELARKDDFLCISGGLADWEFGHWRKQLAPGETLILPEAMLTTASENSFYTLSQRLTTSQSREVQNTILPKSEETLPTLFNEWCTTWGNPDHQTISTIAKTCAKLDFTYLVIDAGWYADGNGSWDNAQGDWIPSKELYPQGLDALCLEIRSLGLIPGLWFEIEVVGPRSALWDKNSWLLQRDGFPVQAGERRFLDLRKDEVRDYLLQKLSGLIESCNLGYIKIDYNETIGLGADDPISYGEGLRQHILCVYEFYTNLHNKFPQVVIENCSSGGHRLIPAMINRTAMTSFSDAHETTSIPIITANIHQAIIPAKAQVWAVLRKDDSVKRLFYSLSSTFLGRMGISGDIVELNKAQLEILTQAKQFYKSCVPAILTGTSTLFRDGGESYLHPSGWQSVIRKGENSTLVVFHAFESAPETISIDINEIFPTGKTDCREILRFFESTVSLEITDTHLTISGLTDFSGGAILIKKS